MDEDKLIIDYLEHPSYAETRARKVKHAVKKRFTNYSGAGTLCVIFPPWHGTMNLDYLIRRRILKKEYSCLEYQFSPRIISSDYKTTQHYFLQIQKKVLKDLNLLKKKYGFHTIHIISFSLGAVNAMMVANKEKKINKIFLHVPGHCLAECLWDSIRTQRIRKKIEKKGITLNMLKKKWKNLAPINNLNNLKNKEVHVILSKKDHVVPYVHGLKLVEALKKTNVKLFVEEKEHLGHYLSVITDLLFPKEF